MRPGDMVYELVSGHGEGREVLCWAPSGRGRERDPEVEDAMDRLRTPGKTCIYITWAPEEIKFQCADRMLERRLRNMRARVRRRDPLFADEMEERELRREKFTLQACRDDLEAKRLADAKWISAWHAKHPSDRRMALPGYFRDAAEVVCADAD